LVELLESRRPRLVELGLRAANSIPGGKQYTHHDIEQMVAGFITIMVEAIEERGKETWSYFMEGLIPGMIASGDTVPNLLYGNELFLVCLIAEISQTVAVEHREEVTLWMAKFCAEYIADVSRNATNAIRELGL
jgi:hypothetical protein